MADLSRYQALQNVRSYFANQEEMAKCFGITQATVSRWLTQSKQMPAEHVLRAEAVTGISRHFLRPDIYPPEHVPPPFDPDIEPPLDFGPIMSRRSNRRESNRNSILDERPAA